MQRENVGVAVTINWCTYHRVSSDKSKLHGCNCKCSRTVTIHVTNTDDLFVADVWLRCALNARDTRTMLAYRPIVSMRQLTLTVFVGIQCCTCSPNV